MDPVLEFDVFLSHNSVDKAWVGGLKTALESRGLRVWLDRDEIQPGDLVVEALERGLSQSRSVVIVVSPEAMSSGWVREEYSRAVGLANRSRHPVRLIAAVLRDAEVPGFLESRTWVDFRDPEALDDGLDRLVWGVTGVKPPPSPTDGEPPAREFSRSVSASVAALERKVKELTEDQFRVIQLLHGTRRARITGCAGSGKTLVAAEKAIRLANAGLDTLFLCHNPLLAEHVRDLTKGSRVRVRDFCSWIRDTVQGTRPDEDWSNYEEPDEDTLSRAFDILADRGPRFDAVVVDEGQDFRAEWWMLVETALVSPEVGILYIFHDDQQALLPHRSQYPIEEPHVNLSRNCRNAGRVYELMRYYATGAPPPDPALVGVGRVLINTFTPGKEIDGLLEIFRRLGDDVPLSRTVVLLGGALHVAGAFFIREPIVLQTEVRWQAGVRNEFDRLWHHDSRGITFPVQGKPGIEARLERLSEEPYPTPRDTLVIKDVLKEFVIASKVRRKLLDDPRFRDALGWKVQDGRLRLWRRHPSPRWTAETLLHFERDWTRGLPSPRTIRLVPRLSRGTDDSVPVFDVGDFKGLEADAIVLMIRGRTPSFDQQTYVGISRARSTLAILVDHETKSSLPPA